MQSTTTTDKTAIATMIFPAIGELSARQTHGASASGYRINGGIRESSWDDGHGNGMGAGGEHGDQRTGPGFAGTRRQDQDRKVFIFLKHRAHAIGLAALQDHQ